VIRGLPYTPPMIDVDLTSNGDEEEEEEEEDGIQRICPIHPTGDR